MNAMNTFSATDHAMMARALRLAERGLYTTAPNPRVGCIIAQQGTIVAEAWHQRAGEPHAEALALTAAGSAANGATAYVSLEPCAHHGRTPPCADALIAAGVVRVVVAAEDPFPQVDGAGLARLRAAGIAVECGLMHEAARDLNRGFFSRIERGRPWLRLKLAQSLDGRIALANGQSQWITGAAARADVQRWRARSDAILTGSGTARLDNPRLTVRWPAGPSHKDPLRVVLDSRLDALAPGYALLDGSAPTLIVHGANARCTHPGYAAVEQVEVATIGRYIDLKSMLAMLAERGINEVQVECGGRLGGSLFAAGLVDELVLYVAPIILGDAGQALLNLPSLTNMDERWGLRIADQRQVGGDLRLLLRAA
ncbi:MAG: bifunctional diaminohydroxyphosphoribosylaminopyrimidine deaminase/5-amino-6-(5-phosphoribosylamino)uracil reductase RibD [Tahibacter sp.]